MSNARAPLVLPAPLQRRLDTSLAALFQPQGRPPEDFSQPAGEPALIAADSLSWQVVKNPAVVFTRRAAAGLIGLGEARVRRGGWERRRASQQPTERPR